MNRQARNRKNIRTKQCLAGGFLLREVRSLRQLFGGTKRTKVFSNNKLHT